MCSPNFKPPIIPISPSYSPKMSFFVSCRFKPSTTLSFWASVFFKKISKWISSSFLFSLFWIRSYSFICFFSSLCFLIKPFFVYFFVSLLFFHFIRIVFFYLYVLFPHSFHFVLYLFQSFFNWLFFLFFHSILF